MMLLLMTVDDVLEGKKNVGVVANLVTSTGIQLPNS